MVRRPILHSKSSTLDLEAMAEQLQLMLHNSVQQHNRLTEMWTAVTELMSSAGLSSNISVLSKQLQLRFVLSIAEKSSEACMHAMLVQTQHLSNAASACRLCPLISEQERAPANCTSLLCTTTSLLL